MSIREDVLRALVYGKDAYYQAIIEVPSYQNELARVRRDYNERTWIDFKGFFPKFTTEEFNKRREKYQEKYGNTVNIPGFADVFHFVPKATITAEERAAHLWAIKRGLPSPLNSDQLQSLKYKKFRFLKSLASATPEWMKTYGAVATTLDNIEDAFVTIVALGRIAVKLAPRLLGRAIPGLGWLLIGSEIINMGNVMSWTGFAAMSNKRKLEAMAEKNPFHVKSKAMRAIKLKRVLPTFGEGLEILQTTDQLFGVGLCLGGLMGLVTDAASTALSDEYWQTLHNIIQKGTVNDMADWISRAAMNDYDKVKRNLQDQWSSLKDEAYRLKAWDEKTRKEIEEWSKEQSNKTWGWIKTIPETFLKYHANTLTGSMIMSTKKDAFLKDDHTTAYMMLDAAIQALMPWWIENDPLANFPGLREFKFYAPGPTDQITIDLLNENVMGWQKTVLWPNLGTKYATIEQIALNYAPLIKDSFQTYCLNNKHEYDAMIAAQQVVEFCKNVTRSFSDDNEVTLGMTAWWAVAEDMMREIFIIPPDASPLQFDYLSNYIRNHERTTGQAPKIIDVARYGDKVGIEWMRTFPRRAFDEAAEIFPEWQEMQDQLEDLYVGD